MIQRFIKFIKFIIPKKKAGRHCISRPALYYACLRYQTITGEHFTCSSQLNLQGAVKRTIGASASIISYEGIGPIRSVGSVKPIILRAINGISV